MEQTHCREPDNPCSLVRERYQHQAKDSQVSQYKLHYRQTPPSPKGSALFLHYILKHIIILLKILQPLHACRHRAQVYILKEQPKVPAHHSCVLGYRVHSQVKWGACPTPDYLHSKERPSITKTHIKRAEKLYSRLVQFTQSEHTYI